jgi:ATP-dependent DNA helicase RecQ
LEQTVSSYLLDAAQEGCPIDWTRYCDEVGLTREIFSVIQGAILKVGATEKLKTIKNELPEAVSLMSLICPPPPPLPFLFL